MIYRDGGKTESSLIMICKSHRAPKQEVGDHQSLGAE